MLSQLTQFTQAIRHLRNGKEELSLAKCCSCGLFDKKNTASEYYTNEPPETTSPRVARAKTKHRRTASLSSGLKPNEETPIRKTHRKSESAETQVRSSKTKPTSLAFDADRKIPTKTVSVDNLLKVQSSGGGTVNGVENGNDSPPITGLAAGTCGILRSGKPRHSETAKERRAVQGLWLEQQSKVEKEILIGDIKTGKVYRKGRLLGKGGFAKCYKFTDKKSNSIYAGKIVSQNRVSKTREKEKMLREVELHRTLQHQNVVAFQSFFEDKNSVYIILEYCSQKSLDIVIKLRRVLLEPEVRYYMKQLIEGCRYVHSQRIVHRDLKLANMLLNNRMQLKIADFGLATRVAYVGEKKTAVCGTPNYIAPEVLQCKGYSYEADVWAMGCIMYAMLYGQPPFQTSSLKETYSLITSGTFTLPFQVSVSAMELIRRFLSVQPSRRPRLEALVNSAEFFTKGYTPDILATSCCSVAPRFPDYVVDTSVVPGMLPQPLRHQSFRMAMSRQREVTTRLLKSLVPSTNKTLKRSSSQTLSKSLDISTKISPSRSVPTRLHLKPADIDSVEALLLLNDNLVECLENMPKDSVDACPTVQYSPLCVTKWVDYSNKYGFGFQLSDGTVGILFNDKSRMILIGTGTILSIDADDNVIQFDAERAPADQKKKVALVLYFTEYMEQNLICGGDVVTSGKTLGNLTTGLEVSVEYVSRWHRTSKAIVMCLSVGSIQVNFFNDHTKVILGSSQSSSSKDVSTRDYYATYVDSRRQSVTYNLSRLSETGCSLELVTRLRYSLKMLSKVVIS